LLDKIKNNQIKFFFLRGVAIIDAVVGGGVVQGLDAGGRVEGVDGEL
jgi:hypothetical protein